MLIQRQKINKGLLFLMIALIAAAIISTVSYAITASGSSTINITPLSTGSGDTAGGIANVSTISVSLEGIIGKATVNKGVVLYKLTMGDAQDSDNMLIELIWRNPHQAAAALLNPNSAIHVRPYFLDSDQEAASGGGYTGDCNTTTQRSFDDEGTKYACPDTGALSFKALTKAQAIAILKPVRNNTSVWYIAADIVVPGGAPPGLQLTENLKFVVSIVSLTRS